MKIHQSKYVLGLSYAVVNGVMVIILVMVMILVLVKVIVMVLVVL